MENTGYGTLVLITLTLGIIIFIERILIYKHNIEFSTIEFIIYLAKRYIDIIF